MPRIAVTMSTRIGTIISATRPDFGCANESFCSSSPPRKPFSANTSCFAIGPKSKEKTQRRKTIRRLRMA